MPGYLKAASFCPVFRKRARCCFQQSDGFSKGARKNDKRYTESNEPVTPTECSESLWMLSAAGKPSYCLGSGMPNMVLGASTLHPSSKGLCPHDL